MHMQWPTTTSDIIVAGQGLQKKMLKRSHCEEDSLVGLGGAKQADRCKVHPAFTKKEFSELLLHVVPRSHLGLDLRQQLPPQPCPKQSQQLGPTHAPDIQSSLPDKVVSCNGVPYTGIGIAGLFRFFPHIREVVCPFRIPLGEEGEIGGCEMTILADARILGDVQDHCHVGGCDEQVFGNIVPILVVILYIDVDGLQPQDSVAEVFHQFVSSKTISSIESWTNQGQDQRLIQVKNIGDYMYDLGGSDLHPTTRFHSHLSRAHSSQNSPLE